MGMMEKVGCKRCFASERVIYYRLFNVPFQIGTFRALDVIEQGLSSLQFNIMHFNPETKGRSPASPRVKAGLGLFFKSFRSTNKDLHVICVCRGDGILLSGANMTLSYGYNS